MFGSLLKNFKINDRVSLLRNGTRNFPNRSKQKQTQINGFESNHVGMFEFKKYIHISKKQNGTKCESVLNIQIPLHSTKNSKYCATHQFLILNSSRGANILHTFSQRRLVHFDRETRKQALILQSKGILNNLRKRILKRMVLIGDYMSPWLIIVSLIALLSTYFEISFFDIWTMIMLIWRK